ncbi:hypothetical protein AN958_01917 [Leucoagaricus sp. SymC.cos]|nr:hypothetical protein AN958_01917 [Leucoagaricus sp. SymC.cos]
MRPRAVMEGEDEFDDWDDDFDQDWDTIDDQTWSLIMKCCSPEPEDRPDISRVRELIVDLKVSDDRPAPESIPDAKILKLVSEPKIDLNRVDELLNQVQRKLDARREKSASKAA